LIGVAAFAGLREGEIRGQWWEDDKGHILNIRRLLGRTHVKYETKTHEDEDRVIKPVLKANGLEWKGWHAYRRGLATNPHELGVPDIVIQAILRHEDVSTTQRSYIKTVPEVVTAAMKRLEAKRLYVQHLYSSSPQAIW
jgi:integrase